MRLVPKKKKVCRAQKFLHQTKIKTGFVFLQKLKIKKLMGKYYSLPITYYSWKKGKYAEAGESGQIVNLLLHC